MKCETCGIKYDDQSNISQIEDIGECIPCQLAREEDKGHFEDIMSQ